MSKSSFLTIIGNQRAALARVVQKAFDSFNRIYGAHAEHLSKCSRASIIHDLMVRHARNELPEPRFRYIMTGQRELFNVGGELLIQFKKLNHSMLSSNYPTHQAELFEETGEIEGLPGIPDSLPLVTIGYVPKPYFAGIEGIFATQTIDHRPGWSERLTDEGNGQLSITSILTPPPHDTETQVKRSRIKRTNTSTETGTGDNRG